MNQKKKLLLLFGSSLAIAILLALVTSTPQGCTGTEDSYTTFLKHLEEGKVQKIRVYPGKTCFHATLSDSTSLPVQTASPLDNLTLETWIKNGLQVLVAKPSP